MVGDQKKMVSKLTENAISAVLRALTRFNEQKVFPKNLDLKKLVVNKNAEQFSLLS